MTYLKEERKKKSEFKFTREDLKKMLKIQGWKCALTGRTLDFLNSDIEMRDPYKKKGRENPNNHYLISKSVSYMARYVTEKNIIKIAIEIVKHRGAELNYTLVKKNGPKKRNS